jgi:hypothetical protein
MKKFFIILLGCFLILNCAEEKKCFKKKQQKVKEEITPEQEIHSILQSLINKDHLEIISLFGNPKNIDDICEYKNREDQDFGVYCLIINRIYEYDFSFQSKEQYITTSDNPDKTICLNCVYSKINFMLTSDYKVIRYQTIREEE